MLGPETDYPEIHFRNNSPEKSDIGPETENQKVLFSKNNLITRAVTLVVRLELYPEGKL